MKDLRSGPLPYVQEIKPIPPPSATFIDFWVKHIFPKLIRFRLWGLELLLYTVIASLALVK